MIEPGFYLGDCMDYLREMPDKSIDLAIVDPPYGIGEKFKGGKTGKMQFNEIVSKGWDIPPSNGYFKELFRVSRKQIVWGGNYFQLPPSRCFICWDKQISEDFSLAMCELAWCSFDALAKIVRIPVPHDGNRIHPTQKPVKLYKWILSHYANPGDLILDTHVGSGSSLVACREMGFKYIGIEIDPDYYAEAKKRVDAAEAQVNIFDFM